MARPRGIAGHQAHAETSTARRIPGQAELSMDAGQESAAAAQRQQLDALRHFVDARLLAGAGTVAASPLGRAVPDLQASEMAPAWVRREYSWRDDANASCVDVNAE